MSVRLVIAFLTCAALPRILVASPGPPLRPGEQLRYSVSWAIVPGAGEINVEASSASAGQLKISTQTSTRGLAKLLLPFTATADSTYDMKSGRPISIHDRSQTRGKHVEHIVTFDYQTRRARYALVGATSATTLEMPAGDPADLITALLDTRFWNIKPGEARDTLVLFNDEFYELTIHALRYEDVTTDLGSYHTLVLQPKMEKTPPKGMFRKGSTVQVWISQDDQKLPVKFEVEFNIGTGTATLEKYTPPPAPDRDHAAPPTADPKPAAPAAGSDQR